MLFYNNERNQKLKIDIEQAVNISKKFITNKLLESGLDGYVVGMSGGIDSAVSAALAVNAVGAEKVYAVLMPYKSSSKDSVDDAMEFVEKFGVKSEKIEITPMIDAYYKDTSQINKVRAGNKMARERMSILFDLSQNMNYLVLGTGNRTEIALGYTTWFGDSACSINPIGQFYKTEIRQIAKILGIPESIINKAPSADLWEGQTDENEIGIKYEQIDKLLMKIIDENISSMPELISHGFDKTDIDHLISLINRYSFKRDLPEISQIGRKNIPKTIEIKE
ncbi:MAG: NAD(+) synthetase [Candidatus Zixiibacteriota bacterium]|nr:MAG: NAD(+) synthetase [candidate division Zixibacteria bacterium]